MDGTFNLPDAFLESGEHLSHDSLVIPTPSRPHGTSTAYPADQAAFTYVWGTGIAVEVFKASFKSFITTFALPSSRVPLFRALLDGMRARDSRVLEVDMSLLAADRPQLFHQVVANPAECCQMMGSVADEVYRDTFPGEVSPDFSIFIACKNLPSCVSLRDLSPQHIETLVAVRGMVVRTSKLIPEVRMAHFQCWSCKYSEQSLVDRGRIFEPVRCAHCGTQYSYQLIHNQCLFEDKQIVRVQEAPEYLAEGETPVTLSVVVYGELVDSVVPGDRVLVTGIFRSTPLKLNSNTRIIRHVFRTHVDASHIEKTARNTKLGATGLEAPPDSTELDQLHRLARLPDLRDILVRSLAPLIWGHDDVKLGVLCQLFGGCPKAFRHGRFRAELNVILCGDPGVAKSQLLMRVHQISPRGVYTSGKGSSSVGLTAFVVRDNDTGEFVLEPGALVLSDRGICCIDEFDKMDDSTRSVLHEVMEQQTLSIAKAGIIAQLNARTSLLAAANPKESQWNPNLNIVENLQIEPTLLSRFDLIFLLLDNGDEAADRKLAQHVLALYTSVSKLTREPEATRLTASTTNHEWLDGARTLPVKQFSKYVAYAREAAKPKLTEEASRALRDAYVDLRKARGSGRTVSATLRQLESMIRLSEAIAKMRLATTVTRDDVFSAKHLISTALREAATDPRTGLINMDIFSAPDPTRVSTESCVVKLGSIIESKFVPAGKRSATVTELRHALNEQLPRPFPSNQFMDVLALMAGGDVILSYTSTTVTFASSSSS